MNPLFHSKDLLHLQEVLIRQSSKTGEYWGENTGNRAEFQIVSDGPVGEGASSRTYEARRIDGVSGRLRLKQCLSDDSSAQHRFLRAALLQQKLLDHPGTVNATAGLFGVYRGEDGCLWAAQDFRDNLCYAEVEEPSVLSALTHLRYFAEAVRCYHALDGETWLLLDLSPDNLSVFRAESGVSGVCLFDFDSMVTPVEVLEGCPLSASRHYAAPEVLRADRGRIDRRADVFSLGMVFFEKLFGRYPSVAEFREFSRYDFSNCIRPQLLQDLSLAAKDALTDFFHHTIASSPDSRYENMDRMLQAIDHLLQLIDPAAMQLPCLTRQNIQPTSRFQGREEFLRAIHENLFARDHRAVLLCGDGGVGKSETARQYASLHREDYVGINFLVCPPGGDWKALTGQLEFVAGEASGLDRHNLIILDNFDGEDPAALRSVLVDFLEHTGEARVLVTTRSCRMPQLTRCAELPLQEEEQLALSVFRANYARPLAVGEEAAIHAILAAVGFNTYATDMIARELSACPQWTPQQFLERMEVLGIGRALPAYAEVSTGKDKDYAPASFTLQVEKLFADVLAHDFTLQQKLVLFLLSHAPARYFSREHICRMVGDHGDSALADQAVEQLLRRSWLRQQMVDDHAAIGVHPLAAEALSGKLAVTGEMLRTLCVNLLTMTEIGEPFFRELYGLVSVHRCPEWPAEILAGCRTEGQRKQERLRNTMILKALYARLASLSLPLWLDNSLQNDPGSGFGVSAVAGDRESARYFCYLEEANLSLQYLYVAHRDYTLQPDQISVEITEACPEQGETISLLRVTTGDTGDQTFDPAVLAYGTAEQRAALHSPAGQPRGRRARSHKVYLDQPECLCRISPKHFRGGFPAASVTRISARAFLGLEKLRRVVLPETLREIEHDAFRHSGLTEVTIPAEAGGITIGEAAFFGCASLTRAVLSEGVTGVFRFAFSDCSALTEVVFPSTLMYLGHNAFARTGLTSLALPEGLSAVGMGAFRETPLETLRLSDNLKIVGAFAFSCCKKLKRVQLGNGVLRIERGAFWGCEALPYLRLPDSLQIVEAAAFSACSALSVLSLPGSVEFAGLALEGCALETVLMRGTASSSVMEQLEACPPLHILAPLSNVHYMHFRRHRNEYVPDPEPIPAVDFDTL